MFLLFVARYKFLDRRLPGRSIQLVLKKVLIDQMIASPCVIFLFFVTLGALRNATPDAILAEMKDKALRLYTAEWVVWPPAQILNFYMLPTRFRVLYDNTISLGYDVYTSAVINTPIQEQHLSTSPPSRTSNIQENEDYNIL